MKRVFALSALIAVLWLGMPAHVVSAQSGDHVVGPGETLYGIAAYYGVTPSAVAAANGISNYDLIYAGQYLTIPGGYKPSPHASAPGGSWQGSYIVKPGDSLYAIAWSTGSTVSALMAANGLMNPDVIYAGQALVIPGAYTPPNRPPAYECGYYYTVKPGDSLSAIAWRSGTTVYALARANGLGYPYVIYGGQNLHIPCDGGSPKPPPTGHYPPKPGQPKPRATERPQHNPAACARAVQIVQPREGEHLGGTAYIVGTADIPNLQFYKLEYAPGHRPLENQFNSIGEETYQRVSDSLLGIWYVGNLGHGDYTLRLTAVDNAGQFPRPCDVRLHIGD